MSYQWSNACRLQTLKAEGEGDVLAFSTDRERARVHLNENDIDELVYETAGFETRIGFDERRHVAVGDGNTQRDVYHYLRPGGPAPTMRLGITKHGGPSTWSSLPHAFELSTEPGFEEVFFHVLNGGSKRAIQVGRGVWSDGSAVDAAWLVRDRTFSTIPMGYHPVVGEPDVRVSYVWVYLCKKPSWEKL
jgi:5-deoxy-D-glucuronate isomerase